MTPRRDVVAIVGIVGHAGTGAGEVERQHADVHAECVVVLVEVAQLLPVAVLVHAITYELFCVGMNVEQQVFAVVGHVRDAVGVAQHERVEHQNSEIVAVTVVVVVLIAQLQAVAVLVQAVHRQLRRVGMDAGAERQQIKAIQRVGGQPVGETNHVGGEHDVGRAVSVAVLIDVAGLLVVAVLVDGVAGDLGCARVDELALADDIVAVIVEERIPGSAAVRDVGAQLDDGTVAVAVVVLVAGLEPVAVVVDAVRDLVRGVRVRVRVGVIAVGS